MPAKKIIGIIFFIAVNVFLFGNAYAAQQEFRFNRMNFTYRTVSGENTTVTGLDRSKLTRMGKTQSWGMIETRYESSPKWADGVELKYYVLLKGEAPKTPVMLSGSVVYIYVQKGREHVSTMYVPPQAIRRYGDVSRVRAELWYNGILQDSTQWPRGPEKGQWWTRVKPIFGSVFNRFYTPFEHEAQTVEEVIKIE